MQAAPDAIVARDRDGRIVTWNPGAEIMFGRSAAEAIGCRYDELLIPEGEREAAAAVLAEVQAGRTLTVLAQRLRADGSRFPAQVSMAPLTLLDGIWQGTLAMVRDITDLVEAERELHERAAQLERSNADLERFAYAASHDLQAPLQSIRLSAGAVIAAAEGRLDPDERELMQHIDAAAHRLSGQIRGLMEVAQVALGASPGAWVRLVVAVRDAVEALRAAAADAGAQISVGELPPVDVPHTEVALVLQNLIANAIKYRRAEVTPEIVISASADAGAVELRVADNGIGIAPEDRDRVFGFFERGPSSAPGTGMGLAVARRMLERYDGTLTATSAGRDQGSVFILRLPLRG